MSNYLIEISYFLLDLLISFIILIFSLRLLLSFFNASSSNSIVQSIIKISKPLKSFLFFIPNIKRLETSSFLIIIVAHFINLYIEGINSGTGTTTLKLIIFSFQKSIFTLLNTLTIIFIILAISSWFTKNSRNSSLDIVYQIANPILVNIRKIIPTAIGVIDFSVIIVLVLIYFINYFVHIIFSYLFV